MEKNCYETVKILENIENWVVKVKGFATFNSTKIIMRDLDVKHTTSRDLVIKRDYQLILR